MKRILAKASIKEAFLLKTLKIFSSKSISFKYRVNESTNDIVQIMNVNYSQGPIPALLNVYKNVLQEFILYCKDVSAADYVFIIDNETDDQDCRSIQTIISHIVNSGYGYAHYIRGAIDVKSVRPEYRTIPYEELEISINDMFRYTLDTFIDKQISYSDVDAKIVKTPWNEDLYSIESILEHAIVHILRHKIQIGRFLELLNNRKNN